MVIIRLSRTGKRNQPFFRVVVQDKRRAPTSKYLELLGHYNPHAEGGAELVIDKERYEDWVSKGAKPSATVKQLYQKAGGSSETEK